MRGILVLLLLFGSLSLNAVAQSATTMTATTADQPATVGQTMSGALPVPAPPSAALPGSGTPVGVPPQIDVNNARTGGAGAVVQPGISDLKIGGQPVAAEPILLTTPEVAPQDATLSQRVSPSGAQSATEPSLSGANARLGRRVFVGASGVPAASQPASLGEFASQLRGGKALAKRTFNNSDIVALNERAPSRLRSQGEDLPQGDQPVTNQSLNTRKRAGVLDQNDLRKVEEAVQRNKEANPKPR